MKSYSSPPSPAPAHAKRSPVPQLHAPGWTPATRHRLEKWLARGAQTGQRVVFDFDHTLVCGDVGEAAFAILVRDRQLTPAAIPSALRPPFQPLKGDQATLTRHAALPSYYETLLAPTAHGPQDPTPLSSGYAWAVQIMQGLPLTQVVEATRLAYACAKSMTVQMIEAVPGQAGFPAPFFYPEMVELIAVLLRLRYDVRIVSASNVWSVRWMVLQGLNPLLRAQGASQGLSPSQVIGVSTLLTDAQGCLYKDAVLVREDPAYANLDARALNRFRLTGWLQFPVPTYSGKVACVWDLGPDRPYLGAGDSPGDHPLLRYCQHRLWIARLEKPDYQRATAALMCQQGRQHWLVQPTLTRQSPGFLPDFSSLAARLPAASTAIHESIAVLNRAG